MNKMPPYFRLTWRTEHAWMSGESVLRYSLTNAIRNVKTDQQLYLTLIPRDKMNSSENTLTRDHWVGLCQYRNVTSFAQCSLEMVQDPSFAFLLSEDHEPDLVLCVGTGKKPVLVIELKLLNCKLITNLNPLFLNKSAIQQGGAIGLYVQKCTETESNYEFQVNVQGVQLDNVTGNKTVCFGEKSF